VKASGNMTASRRERLWRRRVSLSALLLISFAQTRKTTFAGPPFLTDDPEPVGYRHSEFYLFSTLDKSNDETAVQWPAFEFNYGFHPEFQAHIVFPFALSNPKDGPTSYGAGDTEIGVKYRFIEERGAWPQVGIFPMLELPTGDAGRGLGNGRTWAKFPIWAQKTVGSWTTYGGGGWTVNNAPGQRSYPFGGWLVQRDINVHLTLGAEIFAQGKTDDAGRATTIANLGGFYNFNKNTSLLFSLGHSFSGERHLVGYFSLYFTW
jgi:hypothetical protein